MVGTEWFGLRCQGSGTTAVLRGLEASAVLRGLKFSGFRNL